jgi:molybdenum cofactor cytidylyltransferase
MLLTHAGTEQQRQGGRAVARLALGEARVRAVLLAELSQEDAVLEVHGRVAGLVLAAGAGRRLAADKLLLPWRGEPILRHALRAAQSAGLEPIIVVASERIFGARERVDLAGVEWVVNRHPELGQSTSLRLGLQALPEGVEAFVALLGDMPLVSAELIEALVERHRQTLAPVVAPLAGARRGNPVLFDRVTFEALAAVEGDRGGRAIFHDFPPLFVPADERALFDVDSREDYERLLGMGS